MVAVAKGGGTASAQHNAHGVDQEGCESGGGRCEMKKSKRCIAYHFVGDKLRDGRNIPANGVWLEHTGVVKLCESGLHASRKPWDALQYAPGAVLCKVECQDIVTEDGYKLVCGRRKIIARFEATELMRTFARSEALRVVPLWNAPDVVVKYLKTGDESLRVAARRDAAWAAARAAALDAAWVAAWVAARVAAWVAARDAARVAALDAELDAAGKRFNLRVYAAFRKIESVGQ